MRLFVFLILASQCWGGSSLVLGTETASRSSVAAQGANAPCRMEAFLHDVDASPAPNAQSAVVNACGINWQWLNLGASDIRIQLYGLRQTGGSVCQITGLASHLSAGFYLRFQIVPAGAGGTNLCQAWDINGTRIYDAAQTYTGTSGSNSNGVTLTGAGTGKAVSWGFFKLSTETVDRQARMPVHGTDGNLLSWKFDSALTDSSGNSYTATHSGTPAYGATPGQDLMLGVVKTNPSPTWTDRRTLRAGVDNAMNAMESFSQADSSPTVSCDWSVLSTTPASGLTLTIDDASDNCAPHFNPNAFGDYLVRLTMTDAEMNIETSDVHIGAAVMNTNGVITLSPEAEKIFGPMTALGWNPWGLADERHVFAHSARRAYYMAARSTAPSYSYGNPEWDDPQAGTVSWVWGGKGTSTTASCTMITEGLTTGELDIDVANAACLDLSSLPTRVMIQATSGSYAFEEIQICGTTGTSGAQTLTVCYDGRGKDDASGMGSVLGPTAWSSGAVLGQQLIKGTGTDFMGGTETLCEAGAGPMGPIDYQAGTVAVTAGSATITGSGTTWTTGNLVHVGDALRIEGTHSGGTPFVFVAYITTVDSTTQITANRVFPADADTAGGLTYQIIRPWLRLPVTGFTRPTYGGTGLVQWGGTGCESDTQAFFNTGFFGHDVPGLNGSSHSGTTYAFIDWDNAYLNISSTGGINFYGEDLAWYSLWLRSGLAEPKETAELIADHWVRYPFLRGGSTNGPVYSPLFEGGGIKGAAACLVVDPDCGLSWSDLRPYFQQGETYALNATCVSGDTRDSGYLGSWLVLGALFDPDSSGGGFRQRWRNSIDNLYALESSCKGSDLSWSNGFYANFSGAPTVTFTDGSTTGTGSDLNPGICLGRASGAFSVSGNTVTATSGTFSSNVANVNLVMNDGVNRLFTRLTYVDPTHVLISGIWPGASTGTWLQLTYSPIYSAEQLGMTVWGTNNTSSTLMWNYECTHIDSSTIQLERPWVTPVGGSSPGGYKPYTANIAGKGQQPYMAAIKMATFALAAHLDSTLGTDFTGLRDAIATWAANTGFDASIRGMYYARGFQSCEPEVLPAPGTVWTKPGCAYGSDTASQVAARMLNGEASPAFRYNQLDTIARGDEAYAALWCSSAYNDPSVPACDAAAPGDLLGLSNLQNGSLQGGKWPGFFFGMGMAHQWPAARLEAPPGASPRMTGQAAFTGLLQ